MKHNFFALLLALGISAMPQAQAQNITNFGVDVGYGPGVDPGNTWTYNGTTSTLSGSNTNGNVLFGTFENEEDFSGSNQIGLTATVNGGAPGSSFLFTLNKIAFTSVPAPSVNVMVLSGLLAALVWHRRARASRRV